eukprot:m.2918 g.2918  ORF g.2918 m.2918 type:complete len:66 (+) comp8973_c0_seq1:325-522(+)
MPGTSKPGPSNPGPSMPRTSKPKPSREDRQPSHHSCDRMRLWSPPPSSSQVPDSREAESDEGSPP